MRWVVLIGLLIPSLVPTAAQSILINGGSSTFDTATGLEWLDIDQSLGLSWQDVESGIGGFLTEGWQHATLSQICGVLGSGGVSAQSCPGGQSISGPTQQQATNHLSFIQLLGGVSVTNVGFPFFVAHGVFTDDDPFSGGVGLAAVRYQPSNGTSRIVISTAVQIDEVGTTDSWITLTTRTPTAHWLVRAIPEPSTALLLAMGLVTLGWRRRVRQP